MKYMVFQYLRLLLAQEEFDEWPHLSATTLTDQGFEYAIQCRLGIIIDATAQPDNALLQRDSAIAQAPTIFEFENMAGDVSKTPEADVQRGRCQIKGVKSGINVTNG